jgi:hypothetical protein
VAAGQRRHHGGRAGGDDDLVGDERGAGDGDGVRVAEASVTEDDVDARAPQDVGGGLKLAHDLVLTA